MGGNDQEYTKKTKRLNTPVKQIDTASGDLFFDISILEKYLLLLNGTMKHVSSLIYWSKFNCEELGVFMREKQAVKISPNFRCGKIGLNV